MTRTPSTMVELGTTLPPFRLPDDRGTIVSSADVATPKGLLVAFLCPHCPFVKHIRADFSRAAKAFQDRGLGVVAINANDVAAFPEDGPDGMRDEARAAGYSFPYLFDDTQAVAKAFRAACTPDFFLFNGAGTLVYRGQFDGSRPGSDVAVTGDDLRGAVDALLSGQAIARDQRASIGCNIKWKPGNAPDYFPSTS